MSAQESIHSSFSSNNDDENEDMAPLVDPSTTNKGVLEVEQTRPKRLSLRERRYNQIYDGDSDDDDDVRIRLDQLSRRRQLTESKSCCRIAFVLMITIVVMVVVLLFLFGFFGGSSALEPSIPTSAPTALPIMSQSGQLPTPVVNAVANNSNNDNNNDSNGGSPACIETYFNPSVEAFLQPFRSDPELKSCANQPRFCHCANPTIAAEQQDSSRHPDQNARWHETFQFTQQMAANATADVILLGDSITEHWLGTGMHQPIPKYQPNAVVYNELFTRDGGGEIDGIVLGIAADTCANLMYRLEHDQFQSLQAKVVWLLIGTNDLGAQKCSSDAVTAGIVAIVQKLQQLRPDATIVLNSILPRHNKLMTQIRDINERLECLARSTPDRLQYFDATNIFLNEDNGQLQHLPDQLHPDDLGSRLWGEEIVKRAKMILAG